MTTCVALSTPTSTFVCSHAESLVGVNVFRQVDVARAHLDLLELEDVEHRQQGHQEQGRDRQRQLDALKGAGVAQLLTP